MAEVSELKYHPGGAGRQAVLRGALAERGEAFSMPGETTQGWPSAAGETQGSLKFPWRKPEET